MKNYDLLKVVASKLNGLPYGAEYEAIKDLRAMCQDNGIVICYGQSDDLMELDGAIYDEYGCYDGGTICVDEQGNADADANIYYPITAVWAKGNISWQYEFEPRHEVFTFYEDGEIYCKGIVFFVDDLKRNKESDCVICGCKQAEDVSGYVDLYASTIEIVQGGWTALRAGKDKDGKVIMYGMGDGDTALYYPKYCPECGRKLHD